MRIEKASCYWLMGGVWVKFFFEWFAWCHFSFVRCWIFSLSSLFFSCCVACSLLLLLWLHSLAKYINFNRWINFINFLFFLLFFSLSFSSFKIMCVCNNIIEEYIKELKVFIVIDLLIPKKRFSLYFSLSM